MTSWEQNCFIFIVVIIFSLLKNTLGFIQPGVATTSPTARVEKHPNINLLNLDECGWELWRDKISNGDKTELREYPWMALLEYETESTIVFLCSGTLINQNYVLTAAHCVKPQHKLISVRLGEYNLQTDPDCLEVEGEVNCAAPVQNIPVDNNAIFYHHNYDKPKFSNDIALIRLSRPADLSTDDVKPICLPVSEILRNKELSVFKITGWGLTEANRQSNTLLKATVSAIPRDQCQKDYEKINIRTENICAVSHNASNSCAGDSGGPLQYPIRVNGQSVLRKYVQYGIISFGKMDCGKRLQVKSVYTRVASYMNWILDNMKP